MLVVDAGLHDFPIAAEKQESGPDGPFARVGLDGSGVEEHLGECLLAAILAGRPAGLVVGDDQSVVGVVEPVDASAKRHAIEGRGDVLFGGAYRHLCRVLELPERLDGRPCLPAELQFGFGIEVERPEVALGGGRGPDLFGELPGTVRGPGVGGFVAEEFEHPVGEAADEGWFPGRIGQLVDIAVLPPERALPVGAGSGLREVAGEVGHAVSRGPVLLRCRGRRDRAAHCS